MVEYSVLIIDDDVWMQRILAQTLKTYGFKKVLLASNGFDGIALAIENTPHLVISDIMMPEMTGHLVLKLLKTIKMTKNIPILMVTALSDVDNLSRAIKQGSSGFISKPFTRSTVYEKLVDVFGEDQLEKIMQGEAIDQKFFDNYRSSSLKSERDYSDAVKTGVDQENIDDIKELLFDD